MRQKRIRWITITAGMAGVIIAVTYFLFQALNGKADHVTLRKETYYGISNPQTQNGIATWDCVYFGKYWQNDTNGDGKIDNEDEMQPIKWRVLSVDGEDVFLLADRNLAYHPYHNKKGDVEWKDCSLRKWLNETFLQEAFTDKEQADIQPVKVSNVVVDDMLDRVKENGKHDTTDKVYLLSYEDVKNKFYGFYTDALSPTQTRETAATQYAVQAAIESGNLDKAERADLAETGASEYWWLRSPGDLGNDEACCVEDNGEVYTDASVEAKSIGVRPVLHIRITSENWEKAESVKAVWDIYQNENEQLENPQISEDYVLWDSVYFGNYWQEDTNGDGKADKKDKKQPIRWRVLSVNGEDAFLLADQGLDWQMYHTKDTKVNWNDCSLRKWLNETFLNEAFSEEEQKAIIETTVQTAARGNEMDTTSDKIYLLSCEEVMEEAYGFNTDPTESVDTRLATGTTYVLDEESDMLDLQELLDPEEAERWWLRSVSQNRVANNAASVCSEGDVERQGVGVNSEFLLVRPVLHLKISSGLWEKTGKVKADFY